MSQGRKGLNRDELEVHEVLSPASGSSLSPSGPSNGQPLRSSGNSAVPPSSVPSQPRITNVLNFQDLAALLRSTCVAGVKDGLALSTPHIPTAKRKRPVPETPRAISPLDEDLPLNVGMDAVLEESVYPDGAFGADVNDEPDYVSDGDENYDNSYAPDRLPAQPSVNAPLVAPSTVDEEPDADLPTVSSRLPPTWTPKGKVMNWLKQAAAKEWTLEDRKKLAEKFHAPENFDSLLLPVKMPSKLYKAIKAPATKKRDYLLNRQEVEKNLFNSSADLCASLRPLLEAICILDDRHDCKDVKHLVGLGIMGLLSANIKISRSRREVGRRFVRNDCAEALYAVAPSHSSLFGGTSVAEAVKQAKETTRLDDSLVYAPAPKKPFRPTFPLRKGFHRGSRGGARYSRNQDFRQNYYDSQYNYDYKSPQTSSQHRGQSRRGQARGSRRGNKNARKTYSKE